MNSIRRADKQVTWLGTIIVLLIFSLAGTIGIGAKEIADVQHAAKKRAAIAQNQQITIECITTWSNLYGDRIQKLVEADNVRIDEMDKLVREIQPPISREGFMHALQEYLKASDAYKKQAASQPLPPAPEFLCDLPHN